MVTNVINSGPSIYLSLSLSPHLSKLNVKYQKYLTAGDVRAKLIYKLHFFCRQKMPQTCSNTNSSSIDLKINRKLLGNGYGFVADTRGAQFESSHRHFYNNIELMLTVEKTKKRRRMVHFKIKIWELWERRVQYSTMFESQ